MPCVIHWFRRDLRIADNTALYHASSTGKSVIPVYVLSDWKNAHHWTGANRQHFLCGCLDSLSKNLSTVDGRLIMREGDAVDALLTLAGEAGASAIYFNRDPDPFGKIVEERLSERCRESGIECHGYDDIALHNPTEIYTQSEKPYKVFTPYSRNWLSKDKPSPLPKPSSLNTPSGIKSLDLPDVSRWGLEKPSADLPEPGERAARERMKNAVSNIIHRYDALRDIPSEEATSRISQDLRYGLISIRTLYAKIAEQHREARGSSRDSIDIYIKELAWREFYFAILHHFPHVLDHEFNQDWKGLPWEEPGENFEKWKKGETGFPIVDAGMRQLLKTGFMHNRVRMITAMFLTKDLHIDWKLGESHFMQHLTDGEIASNNGGWQWSAGTGADAAPYFRIQNPWSQTARYDPQGKYIKRWIPELKDVPPKKFQAPPEDDKPIAEGYPLPCVNHKDEREKTLAIFKRHRG
ncbi:MAG: DNA photolyase family protein [Akkermansiaceae bacterium]|jgi:deoxyribodipyrimidine photo-lyase|nr:DNA photolyase family protein [Akkermansiaceae bacterium]MDP4647926.1 DNA photolyase family protein [Akkermansiaceae bacterium]MDP4719715.1 DNA photolyase family protein [Akkermansiaceae bacterium]MDP4781270.1 DNA photolyase family protein [Akkermansiaceae bacterium]MDP4846026.1 DNA photolyase family protein [Akkermansiaceae bacterium]